MELLITQMSMSLDGFIAGPKPAPDNLLGHNMGNSRHFFIKSLTRIFVLGNIKL